MAPKDTPLEERGLPANPHRSGGGVSAENAGPFRFVPGRFGISEPAGDFHPELLRSLLSTGGKHTPAKSLRKSVNFYQIFTNRPEDWHFWRSARSGGGKPCGNS